MWDLPQVCCLVSLKDTRQGPCKKIFYYCRGIIKIWLLKLQREKRNCSEIINEEEVSENNKLVQIIRKPITRHRVGGFVKRYQDHHHQSTNSCTLSEILFLLYCFPQKPANNTSFVFYFAFFGSSSASLLQPSEHHKRANYYPEAEPSLHLVALFLANRNWYVVLPPIVRLFVSLAMQTGGMVQEEVWMIQDVSVGLNITFEMNNLINYSLIVSPQWTAAACLISCFTRFATHLNILLISRITSYSYDCLAGWLPLHGNSLSATRAAAKHVSSLYPCVLIGAVGR